MNENPLHQVLEAIDNILEDAANDGLIAGSELDCDVSNDEAWDGRLVIHLKAKHVPRPTLRRVRK